MFNIQPLKPGVPVDFKGKDSSVIEFIFEEDNIYYIGLSKIGILEMLNIDYQHFSDKKISIDKFVNSKVDGNVKVYNNTIDRLGVIHLMEKQFIGTVNYKGHNVEGLDLSNIKFSPPPSFAGLNCKNTDFSFSDLGWASFEKANLENANLNNSNLNYANLRGSNLFNASIVQANLNDSSLRGAIFDYANLTKSTFKRASIGSGGFLVGNHPAASFKYANLDETNFRIFVPFFDSDIGSGTNANKVDFRGAKIRNANFGHSNFKSCNFSLTDMTETLLDFSVINDADFRSANLTKASFENSDIRGANFANCNLMKINLKGSIFNNQTIFPENFDPLKFGAILQNGV